MRIQSLWLAGMFLIISFSIFSQNDSPVSGHYNILNYGAIADDNTVNTSAIKKTVDDCASNGGGKVIVPPGVFITGTIQLKDNVYLYLEAGSVLKN